MDLPPDAAAAAGHLASTYRWIPIAGGFVAVAWAMAVGAVDLPLSFGPAVGSGALTLPQAVLLASLLEISGAYLLGIREWDTLLARVMRHKPPGQDDALLMWGLFICLIVGAAWLAAAAHWELPVSSTLAAWGAIIGVLLSVSGVKAVYWNKDKSESALGVGGVLSMVLSWILAPCIAAAIAFLVFFATKHLVLRAQHCVERSLRAMPIYYGVTVAVLIYFVIYRACPRVQLGDLDPRRASMIAGLSGCLASVLAYLIVVPVAQRRLGCFDSASSSERALAMPSDGEGSTRNPSTRNPSTRNPSSDPEQQQEEQEEQDGKKGEQELSAEELIQQFTERKMLTTVLEGDEEEQSSDFSLHYKSKSGSSPAMAPAAPEKPKLSFGQLLASTPNRLLSFQKLRRKPLPTGRERFMQSLLRLRTATYSRRLTYDRPTLVRHALAEKFDSKAEELFSFLQILTACAAALAHGSNELAWAMGPYAAVVEIYSHSTVDGDGKGSLVPWVLALGGAGASVGFAVWGWKIIRSVGGRLIYLSPARGFSAQISALATVLLALKVGLPLSTTHILIGALVGVGLADSRKHVNWPLLATFVAAWAAMLLLTCGTAAAFYSFTVYSPSYRGNG